MVVYNHQVVGLIIGGQKNIKVCFTFNLEGVLHFNVKSIH